jgi:hypothetical protein
MKRLVLVLSLLVPTQMEAWGEKGHFIVNEAATLGLPNDMPHFFYRSFPELTWLGYDPDRWKHAGDSIEAAEAPNHFLDYEFVAGLELPPDRHEYLALLESSGRLRQKGITNADPGFVPWRIAELSEKLTSQFRQWRFSRRGSSEREFLERGIINTAGTLGHYVADSANPHHATINHNGWIMPNPHGYPVDCGTHSRFESTYISHAVEPKDVTPKLASPARRTNYFDTALDFIKASNALTERLYQIDKDGGFDIFRPVQPVAFEFATDRLAAGASMLRDLWWSAWKNSSRRR